MEINTLTSTENLFFKLSVAESLLNDCSKDENLFKSLNIFKEILNSDIEKNSKNILNTILAKLAECYLKSTNKIRFAINHLIFLYRDKFSDIFISKDITNNIIAIATCSDCIARSYSLQLISYLPYLLDKRLELLHTVYDLYVSDKSLFEEKMIILDVFRSVLRSRGNSSSVLLVNLIVNNFEVMIKVKTCKGGQDNFDNFFKICCGACYKLKIKYIDLVKRYILLGNNFGFNIQKMLKEYFKSNYVKDCYKISAKIFSLIWKFESNNSNNLSNSNFIQDMKNIDEEKFNYIFLYYLNICDADDEKFLMTIRENYETIFSFLKDKIEKKNFLITFIFSLQNNFDIPKESLSFKIFQYNPLTKLVNILHTALKLNLEIKTEFLLQLLNKVSENEVIDNETDLHFFSLIANIKKLITIIKQFPNLDSLNKLLLHYLTQTVITFQTKNDYLKYNYFLDKLSKELKNSEKVIPYIQILLDSVEKINEENIKKFVLFSIQKISLIYNISVKEIERRVVKNNANDFGSIYSKMKKSFVENKIEEAESKCNRLILFLNSDISEYFKKMFALKKDLNDDNNDLTQFETKIKEFVEIQILLFENERKDQTGISLSKFSKDFITSYSKLLLSFLEVKKRICYSLTDDNIKSMQDLFDNILNSPSVFLITAENKLNFIIDIKTKLLNKNLIINNSESLLVSLTNILNLYSKFLLIILPPLDIQIITSITKSNIENVFIIQTKISLSDFEIYFKNVDSVYISISLNYKQIKEVVWDMKNNYNKTQHSDLINESVFFFTKNKMIHMKEIVLTFNFSFIHEDFFKINFYEHTTKHLI